MGVDYTHTRPQLITERQANENEKKKYNIMEIRSWSTCDEELKG